MGSWHPFVTGEPVAKESVLRVCEERLASGAVLCGDEKRRYVALMREHAPAVMVWSPMSSGWGASPFNPNNWRSLDGQPVLPVDIQIYEPSQAEDA
jgi:hypothetical protein